MKRFSEETRQTLQAIAVCPLSIVPAMFVGVTFAFFLTLLHTHEIPTNALSEYTAAFVMALVGLIYGYVFTIFYGVPVYLVLKKIKMLNIFSVSLLSLLPAMIVGVSQSNLMAFLFMGYFSLWVSIVFLWLAPKHTPIGSNKSSNLTGAKNAPPS